MPDWLNAATSLMLDEEIDTVPPSVRLPVVVTVPVSVIPLTVPVPPTDVTVPLLSAAIDIVPVPLVTVIPVPPVSVALAKVFPVVLPINSWPLVYEVWPVPPSFTDSVPVCES